LRQFGKQRMLHCTRTGGQFARSSVTILRSDGREQIFRVVGEDEADPARGTISRVSPLARALFGKGVGETVSVAGMTRRF
jgi:transcription elongation GreA/GreB family factor